MASNFHFFPIKPDTAAPKLVDNLEGSFAHELAMARSLLVLFLICVLNCSTSSKRHSQPKLKELPVPVKVEPETAAAVPETPSELEPPSPTPEPRFYIHRVRWPGETLSIIAQWYTGSLKNWKALSNANPTLDTVDLS